MKLLFPANNTYWYFQDQPTEKLSGNITTDVVVVGGGMAGLSAAQSFKAKNLDVVLVEKNFCGSGASGKSSGFITPDSEYSLHDFEDKFDRKSAHEIWEFALGGVQFIENNIKNYSIECDYTVMDTLVLANTKSAYQDDLLAEYKIRSECGYQTNKYEKQELARIVHSDSYYGGISYGGSFGINCFDYCRAMSRELKKMGVKIFEQTPATKITPTGVETIYGKITAKYIVVCVDKFLPQLHALEKDVYSAQTFLMCSYPLSDAQIRSIFPNNKYMVWDTDMIYHYWRPTGDNRLLLGGSNLLYTFSPNDKHNNALVQWQLARYFEKKFKIKIEFEYMWSGLIGLSKDVMPIGGPDRDHATIFYIAAGAGLPWCAALGRYSAEYLIDNNIAFDRYFSPYRKYPIGHGLQRIMGKKLTFALSNFLSIKSL